ncbi:glycosyltransferase [Sphingobacterium deserti]|uniref:Capsular polysaccharide biosynthesis protein Cps4H n=1 Tax=Sphingobacterium deserti TaxID=1229276 RepID=A0A0B8T0L3_9SPHI|nr:glycosyltransferase [Sphingobacterium deserti]KGE14152.1 capsular polysaccharide biosynthesis protein Cps4H [Sphingobacterium deserti]
MKKNMRILHVVTRVDAGGISTFLHNYYTFSDRSNMQFDIVAIDTGYPQGYHEIFTSLGVNVFYMPNPVIQRVAFLTRLIRSKAYDVVHAHIELQSSVYLALAALCGVKKRVAHAHLSRARHGFSNSILRLLMNMVVTARVGASDLSINAVFGKQYAKNAVVLYNAVDVKKFSFQPSVRDSKRTELGLSDRLIVGFVGRLSAQKNVFFLLEIIMHLAKVRPEAILLIVGEGELRTEMEEKIREFDIESNVVFLNNREDIPQLMMAMDALLLPSFYEGLPLVLVEAQAAALKCLVSENVTKLVDVTEFIRYLDIENASMWSETIAKECLNYPRYSVEESITKKRFNIRKEAQNLNQFYKELIDK